MSHREPNRSNRIEQCIWLYNQLDRSKNGSLGRSKYPRIQEPHRIHHRSSVVRHLVRSERVILRVAIRGGGKWSTCTAQRVWATDIQKWVNHRNRMNEMDV